METRNFAEILGRWEEGAAEASSATAEHPVALWLRSHSVDDKDANSSDEQTSADKRRLAADQRKRLRQAPAEATIDLHGLNTLEAWECLEIFMRDAKNAGHAKVLIIHGKGHHGKRDRGVEPPLRRTVRRFLESCPFAGEHRAAAAADGGTGATWVVIK